MPDESIAYRSALSTGSQVWRSAEDPQVPQHFSVGPAACVAPWQHWVSWKQLEAQCGLRASQIGIFQSPLLATCLSLSSCHLHLIHSFSSAHVRFLLVSNLLHLFFFCPWLSLFLFICLIICPWAQLFPLPHSSAKCFPAAFNSLLFCSFLLSSGSCCCSLSYLFFHLPGIHFSVQQCSSCLSCYTQTYFSILLCYFSHFSFPTLLFFQVTSNLHDNFS